MKTALVLGAGGFIGSHMVNRLKSEGYWVRGVDLKHPDFSNTQADEFIERESVYELMVCQCCSDFMWWMYWCTDCFRITAANLLVVALLRNALYSERVQAAARAR